MILKWPLPAVGHLVGDSDGQAGVSPEHGVDGVNPLNVPRGKPGSAATGDVDAVTQYEWPRQKLQATVESAAADAMHERAMDWAYAAYWFKVPVDNSFHPMLQEFHGRHGHWPRHT